MKLCRVKTPGFFTTIQDLGRRGFQKYGVSVSGAMDDFALTAANLLVGNKAGDSSLEVTLRGPTLEFLCDVQIAVAGAALSPTIDNKEIPLWQTVQVSKGKILSFGRPQSGCRAYLAVKGGIDVPPILNSRSANVRGGFGGLLGRQLKKGDVLKALEADGSFERGYSMPQRLVPSYDSEFAVKVVLGPQLDYFTENGLETFLSNTYTVTVESDRMGYRLDGANVEQKDLAEMVSDAIPVGAVQVSRDGKPIIMMRDAQTTGGYPKIAVVATPDISRLGQAKPNDKIRFSAISTREARENLLEYASALSRLKDNLIEVKL